MSGPAAAPRVTVDYAGMLSLAGRTCVVLGGAFLLRALTDSGRLPSAGGVGLGFAYAVAWIGVADQTSRRRPVSGLFHGLAGVLIGLPLLWEASMHFHLLAPPSGALALSGLTALALVVAWHRDLQLLAGLVTCGAVVTTMALAFASGAMLPSAIFLVALSAASWWMSDACHWPWLKWPPALAASLLVLVLAGRAGAEPPLDWPPAVLAVAAVFAGSVLAMVTRQLVVQRKTVRAFDAVHTLIALVAALAACLAAAPHAGRATPAVVHASMIVLGISAYAVALTMHARRSHERSLFYYYSTLGAVLVIWGSGLALDGIVRDVVFTLLAIASVWLATRTERSVFAAHSAVYAVTAATSAGLIACTLQVWLTAIPSWPTFPPTGWLVLVAALPGGLIPRAARSRGLELVLSMSRLALAIVVVGSVAGLIVLIVGPLAAGTPPDLGRLASLKTVILSAAAVALAFVRRLPFGGELGWLAYPVLIAGGAKLLVEDFRVSAPSTLFIALAVYGVALILTARIGRAHAGSSTG